MTAMHRTSKQRTRVIVLTVAIILLLVALLSDLGQGVRDWLADVWDRFNHDGTASVSVPDETTEVSDAAADAHGDRGALARPLTSLPRNADDALVAAAYRGQAGAAGAKRAAGSAGLLAGGPANGSNAAGGAAGQQLSADGANGSGQGQGGTSVLALAEKGAAAAGDAAGVGGAGVGGGEFGGGGPFSTVPGGPFVNLTDSESHDSRENWPNDTPSSVPEPGTLLLLASAAVGLGVRRWRRR